MCPQFINVTKMVFKCYWSYVVSSDSDPLHITQEDPLFLEFDSKMKLGDQLI